MIQVRPWDIEKDGEMIKEWFHGNGSEGPHLSQLPPLGCISFDEEGDIAAVGAYQSVGVGVAFPEWLVTNPDVKPRRKLRGTISVMEGVERMLAHTGYELFRINVLKGGIARLATKHLGYKDIGLPVQHLVKVIQ